MTRLIVITFALAATSVAHTAKAECVKPVIANAKNLLM